MRDISSKVIPRSVTISAEADFTIDMALNLVTMFEHVAEGEAITVKFSDKGVWAVTPLGTRLFIGSTKPFEVGERNAGQAAAKTRQ